MATPAEKQDFLSDTTPFRWLRAWLWPLFADKKGLSALLVLVSVASAAAAAALPLWALVFRQGRGVLGGLGVLLLMRALLNLAQEGLSERFCARAMGVLSERVCRGFAAAPFEVRSRFDLSGFLLLFSQTGPRLELLVRELPRALFGSLPLLMALLVAGLCLNPPLVAGLLAAGLVLMPVFLWQSRARARLGQAVLLANAKSQRRLRELNQTVHGLWGMMGEHALRRALIAQQQYLDLRSKNHFRSTWLVYLSEAMAGGLLVLGQAQGLDSLALGRLMAGLLTFHVIFSALRQLLRLPMALKELAPQLEKMVVLFAQPHQPPQPWPATVASLSLTQAGYVYGAGTERPVTGLHPVDLSVAPGKMTVITGPNGAGKSTLLRLLSCRLFPTSGQLRIDGVALLAADLPRLSPRLAYLPQDVMLPEMTVRELLEDLTSPRGLLLLRKLGIMPLLERASRPDSPELSRGEIQKILLAKVLLSEADAYFLDEWDTALDAVSREVILSELRALAASKIVVCVTHDETLVGEPDKRVRLGK